MQFSTQDARGEGGSTQFTIRRPAPETPNSARADRADGQEHGDAEADLQAALAANREDGTAEDDIFVYEDDVLDPAGQPTGKNTSKESRYDSAEERRLSELRKFLTPATLDRPQKFGDRGVTSLSLRRFQRDVLDFLGRYGTSIPQSLAINFVRHLLVGEMRRVADAYPTKDLTLDMLWAALYRAQPPGVGSLPTLLLHEASRIQLKRSEDPAQAAEYLDDYLSKYSELDRLAQPLTRSEELGMTAFVLPRQDELIQPFLNGLKRTCALGTHVGTALSQDRFAVRTLSAVIDLARMASMNNPELLTASPLMATPLPKARHAGVFEEPTPSAWERNSDTSEPSSLNAFAARAPRAPNTDSVPRPNEPPRDDALTCGICVARHPDWVKPGRGHSARWCGRALGKYNPRDPATHGPATDQQIMVALEIAARESRRERDKQLSEGPYRSQGRTARPSEPRPHRFNALDTSGEEPEEPLSDDQSGGTDLNDQEN